MFKIAQRLTLIIGITLFASLILATSAYADGTIIVEAPEPDIFPDGQCSLIEAIHNANNDAQTYTDCLSGDGDDTIVLQAGHIYTLTALDDTTSDLDGLPPIISTIIIDGKAATIERSTIFGIDEFRIFHVGHPGNLTLKNLTISNGNLFSDIGGGIWNHYDGIVTLINVTVTSNTADEGSGIYNSGTMVINTSIISGNNAADSINGTSAGIMNDGVLTMTHSIVANNIASHCGGVDNSNDVLFISNSTIDNNSGGLCNIGRAVIVRSTISNNHDGGDGGGINNNESGTLIVENSTISNNTAGNGGGIQNSGTTTVKNSTISSNTADFAGGGVDNRGTVNLTNVTITNNTANNDNDGGSEGGGGGICQWFGTVNMVNTILAGNIDRNGEGPDCRGEIISIGHNLIQDTADCSVSGPATGDIVGQDPHLGPLVDNNGDTLTHALLPGSPAIDAGNSTDAPLADQRGVPRIFNTVDIGAYESPDLVNEAPVVAVPGSVFTLYDSSLGNTPDDQGFTYRGVALTPPILASQVFATNGTVLNTRLDYEDHAGYLGQPDLMPTLDRASGYVVTFTAQIVQEDHPDTDRNGDGKDDRAGFNVIVLSGDNQGIALGFWKDKVWAYEGGTAEPPNGTLFTHAEAVTLSTTSLMTYSLAIQGDTYNLSTNGFVILTGNLRNYTAFEDVLFNLYSMPNLIFLGDNTASARAQIKLGDISVATGAAPLINSDDNSTIRGITVNDVDVATHTLTTTLSVISGTLSVTPVGTTVSTSTGQITITGNLTNTNRTLATGVTCTPHITEGIDSLTVIANDRGHTGFWPFVEYGDAQSSGVITVSGSIITMTNQGSGMSQLDDDGADSGYLFTYQKVTGDFDVYVRSVSQSDLEDDSPLDGHAKFGLEVRESLAPTANKIYWVTSKEYGLQYQIRGSSVISNIAVHDPSHPVWLRIVRNESNLKLFYSYDNADGTLRMPSEWILQTTQNIPMSPNAAVFLGLVNTPHDPSKKNTVVFDNYNLLSMNSVTITIKSLPPSPPQADFVGNPRSGDAPLTVQFTSTVTGTVTAYGWNFGDSGIADTPNPTHTYQSAGNFGVTLVVTGPGGTTNVSKPGYITVNAPPGAPTATFSADVTGGTAPLTVTFTAVTSGTVEHWLWSFGDGGTASTGPVVSHTYATSGTFDVSLTVSNTHGSFTLSKPDYIIVTVTEPPPPAPQVSFVGNPRSGDAPLTVQFTSIVTGTVTAYSWRFGDGGIADTPDPTHTYRSAGIFGVTLVITGPGGTANVSKPGYITVNPPPGAPTATFSADVVSGTAPLTVTFTAVTSGTVEYWLWSFGDGGTAFTGPVVSHTYVASGTFDVSLTVSNTHGSFIVNRLNYIIATEPPPVCEPISEAQLSRVPAGDLFTGNTVRFTADADGTTPFAYTWTLNDTPVGENRSTFEHTFDAAGTYTVTVTVANACSQRNDTMVVKVQEPAPEQPDLSQSYKSVNLTSVEAGDILTYTLILRNRSDVTATATLTDPIPTHTTYVSPSAQASSGVVTVDDGQLLWSGKVISGTVVIVEFAVEVQAADVGTLITNVARLDDGLGNVILLEARSTYNPGYRLSVNDGALYTNAPTVTLSLSWGAEDPPIEWMQISNDGGFGTGTGWIGANVTYTNWLLDTYGNWRMPRVVYAMFRDGAGKQYGPVQDDIIYDPISPQVTEVEIITQTVLAVSAIREQDVIVRVTTSDDNSGVSKVQISHSADFEQFSEFAATGGTTDIPWTLQPSGEVYVRVVDRAGNLSKVKSEQGEGNFRVYLPLVARNVP